MSRCPHCDDGPTHEEFLETSAREHGWSVEIEKRWQALREAQYQMARALQREGKL